MGAPQSLQSASAGPRRITALVGEVSVAEPAIRVRISTCGAAASAGAAAASAARAPTGIASASPAASAAPVQPAETATPCPEVCPASQQTAPILRGNQEALFPITGDSRQWPSYFFLEDSRGC